MIKIWILYLYLYFLNTKQKNKRDATWLSLSLLLKLCLANQIQSVAFSKIQFVFVDFIVAIVLYVAEFAFAGAESLLSPTLMPKARSTSSIISSLK